MNLSILKKTFLFLFCIQGLFAQKPFKPNSVEIFEQIKKLNFLGSVLYVAAHPDDENTKLITYLSNKVQAKTAYLSLTRGDGGQNLIGSEMRELLGVIRTQELLEARKIDGGEQMFSRANDFGFSKNPKETLEIWDKKQVLADVVWAIRKFQPDIIINRFDHRTAGNTHGHHTASALLSVESFDLSNDSKAYPEQLQFTTPWQVKRQFFNPSYWFYGSQEKFDAADKSSFAKIQTGVYYASKGLSNQEISALSRSCHQSQAYGTIGSRGEEVEYLEFINGMPLNDLSSIFDGIDTSWNRLKGGKPIGDFLSKIEKNYNFNAPENSIPDLIKAYQMVQSLEDSNWKKIKLEDLQNCIVNCSGLFLEAVSSQQNLTPGAILSLKIEAINRSNAFIQLKKITTAPDNQTIIQNKELKNNVVQKMDCVLKLPLETDYSQPYWLKEEGTIGMYAVNDPKNIGLAESIRNLKVVFSLEINNVPFEITKDIVYKYNDPAKGEQYFYVAIVPEVSTEIVDATFLFNDANAKKVAVKVKAAKDAIVGQVALELPTDWLVSPKSIHFELAKKDSEKIVYFEVSPPNKSTEVFAKAVVTVNNKNFSSQHISIDYPHIAKQEVLKSSQAKFIKLDLKTQSQKIGYIIGAGDVVPESLLQMGYEVKLLKPEDINEQYLNTFDVIITGIRAYNTLEVLVAKQHILFDFVKKGKTMVVQYNSPNLLPGTELAPFPLKLSLDRVNEENAVVDFLAPNHPVLNHPNTITKDDFKGWTQEQGLYYPNEFDVAFTPIITANDTGETPKKGALLVASYGKGFYVYTGLSFFRELPAGVSGAYRLMANIIALKNQAIEPTVNKKL